MKDMWDRHINYMRISVTDQCNLRCCYCMPENGTEFLAPKERLQFDEIEEIVRAGSHLGIKNIKLTGGEPLTRKDLPKLIKTLKEMEQIEQVTLTTNGVLLEKYAEELKDSGVDSINVNFPALTRETYHTITRRDEFEQVMSGINKIVKLGIKTKLNCVSRKTITDDELLQYAMIAQETPIEVRFIEMMPLGYGKQYETYENEHMLERLEQLLGMSLKPSTYQGNGPAKYYEAHDFKGKIGFISAISHKFCDQCNRVRVTADGDLKLCLNYDRGISLKHILRSEQKDQLEEIMRKTIYEKPKEHSFYSRGEWEEENKNMVQIGG